MGVRTFALQLMEDGYKDIEQQLLDWNYPCADIPIELRDSSEAMFDMLCNLDDNVGEDDYILVESTAPQKRGYSGRIFFTRSNDALAFKLSCG